MSPRYRTLSGRAFRISCATGAAWAPPAESPTAQTVARDPGTALANGLRASAASLARDVAALARASWRDSFASEPPHPIAAAASAAISSGMSREAISRPLPGQALVEFPDPEDLRPAVRACALNSRATVLHRHLGRVLDLDLLLLLEAITLRHDITS